MIYNQHRMDEACSMIEHVGPAQTKVPFDYQNK